MRIVRAIHDLAAALIAGGVAGGAICAILLFREAPTREIAGAVGQTIFNLLGAVMLALSVILLACRAFLQRLEPSSRVRSTSLLLALLCVLVSGLIALWITPAMDAIWRGAPHAPDGSGLTAEARGPFMRWHGIANLGYLTLLAASAGIIVLGPTLRPAR